MIDEMKDYRTLKYAISDYTGGNTNEGEFVDRLRRIEKPSPSVIECINSGDTMRECIRNVERSFSGLNNMSRIVGDIR